MRFQINFKDETGDQRARRRARLFCRRAFSELIKEAEFKFLKNMRRVSFATVMVSRRRSLALNRRFRRKAQPTNILSFPVYKTLNDVRGSVGRSVELGDIVVCPAVIRQEARTVGNEFYAQFFWMLLHGILHLLGYDHERSARERAHMEALESKILERFHPVARKPQAVVRRPH